MRFLVAGASGHVGFAIYRSLSRSKPGQVTGTFHATQTPGLLHLDIANEAQVTNVFESTQPTCVVFVAGCSSTERCQRDPELSRRLNFEAVCKAVDWCQAHAARLILLSTDYVFDGKNGPYREEDLARPINVYGRDKLRAESEVLDRLPTSAVVRTCQVYGDLDKGGLGALRQHLANGKDVVASESLVGTPTHASDLAAGVLQIIDSDESGIFHVAGPEVMSRFEFAQRAASALGFDPSLIRANRSNGSIRPASCGLVIEKMVRRFGYSPRPLLEGLSSPEAPQRPH